MRKYGNKGERYNKLKFYSVALSIRSQTGKITGLLYVYDGKPFHPQASVSHVNQESFPEKKNTLKETTDSLKCW